MNTLKLQEMIRQTGKKSISRVDAPVSQLHFAKYVLKRVITNLVQSNRAWCVTNDDNETEQHIEHL
jgi:hypothetical protein